MKKQFCLGVMDLENGTHNPNTADGKTCIECGRPIDTDTLDAMGVA